MKKIYSFVIVIHLICVSIYSHEEAVRPNRVKVAIIGAGLAGLDIGLRLRDEGIQCSIFEARGRVGGRILSVLQCGGHIVELGGENIYDGGDADNILALVKELGIEVSTTMRGPRKRYHFDGTKHVDSDDALRAWHITPRKLKKKLARLQRSARTMHDVLIGLFRSSDTVLYQSFSTRLAAYEGAPVTLLSPVCTEALYHMIINKLQQAQSTHGLYGFAKEGNSRIPEALADRLQGCIHVHQELKAIEKDRDGGYRLSFASGSVVLADIVVLTIPCPVYKSIQFSADVLSAERLSAIISISCGTNAKIIVPVAPPEEAIGGCTGAGHVMAFQGSRENAVTMFYIGEHGHFTEDTIHMVYQHDMPLLSFLYEIPTDVSQPCIARDVPYALYNGPVGYSWPEDPYAQCSYSCLGIGQEKLFTSLESYEGEEVKTLFAPVDGTLFFAGEAASTLLETGGTMEAAVESGERIARILIKKLKQLASTQAEIAEGEALKDVQEAEIVK